MINFILYQIFNQNIQLISRYLLEFGNYFHVHFFFQFATFETVVSGFVDSFPDRLLKRKTLFTAFMCGIAFIIGFPLITNVNIFICQYENTSEKFFSRKFLTLILLNTFTH